MPEIKLGELLIIVVVLFVVFGPNKLSDLGGALGRSIRGFRTELKAADADAANGRAPAVPPPDQPSAAGESLRCTKCGGRLSAGDKFCTNCGTAVEAAVN